MILQPERSMLQFPGPRTAFRCRRCVPAYFNPWPSPCSIPVWEIYLGTWPASQFNLAWPSLRG